MKKIVLAVSILICGVASAQHPATYADPSAPAEARISDLLARMTLDEKIDALGTNPTVPRLGVVGTGHVEGLHGLALGGPGGWEGRNQTVIPTTQFPQSRGLGQTWDPALLQQAAAAEAYETRFAFGKYHRGGLVVRAPNADLSRDPRWGRSEESYGEDPFLAGTMATAFAQGLEGDGRYWMTASLLKHFLANSNEDGRDGSSSNFDERLFHEYYAVPFRMAIEGGKANAFMTSYNAWNKVPMAANPVLRAVVMKDWGFDGILCTDAGALTNMVKSHHAFQTMPEAAAAAIHAGINQFLDDYKKPVRDALAQKLVTEADLDKNLRGVFRVMLRLGMLDPNSMVSYAHIGFDERPKGEPDADPWMWPDRHALARKVTEESIVLLKNEGHSLPLDGSKLKSIAVIGPLADKVALDWYSGTPPYTVTPLEGIRARAGSAVHVEYADGSDPAQAAALAGRSDVAIVIIGNHPTCDAGWMKCPTPSDGKEAIDRKSLTLAQESLAQAALAANPKTVVVLQASFPFTTTWTQANVPAVLTMTHNSEEQGNALADVLFGDYNPAGRLTQTWVASEADLPPMMDYNIRHGRTYLYARAKPLYAFGFGLSYTSFAYSHLEVKPEKARPDQTVEVSFELRNTGDRAGDEVAQMYVTHVGSRVERPLQELKGFQRISLQPGQVRRISLTLPVKALAYWNEGAHAFVVENDSVKISVGGSSDRLPLQTTIQVIQ
jgi:beta-glucosidase